MPDDLSTPLDPDRIPDQKFGTVRKGADPAEVQRYLRRVAAELKSSLEREADLRRQLERIRTVPTPVPTPEPTQIDPIDPSHLTKLLGEETARVLDAAQAAASEIRAKAEEGVARMLREAREEAMQIRQAAESEVATLNEKALAELEQTREKVVSERERATMEAAQIIEESKREGRSLVIEAQQMRKRMLDDLAERREQLNEQIEQLQAGRDRLMAAYDNVRQSVVEATAQLRGALPGTEEIEVPELPDLPEIDEMPAAVRSSTTPPVSPALPRPVVVTSSTQPKDDAKEDSVEKAEVKAEAKTETKREEKEATTENKESTTSTRSGSARVVRTSSGKASDVFARLREEGEKEAREQKDDDESPAPESKQKAEKNNESSEDSTDDDQRAILRRNDVVQPISSSLTRRLKRELSDEQNEILAAITSVKGAVNSHDILPIPEDHLERYDDLVLPALGEASEAGGRLAGGRPGSRTSVADLSSNLAESIVLPLRERLERCVTQSGGDRDDLAQSVRAVFREWKGQRVDDVVEAACLAACNRGYMDKVGKGVKVRWIVAAGDPPSPDCDDNALAGAIDKGTPFPTGHLLPPLQPGCHCFVVAE